MTEYWCKRRVVITGGMGFLGKYVVEKLKNKGCRNLFIPRHGDYDLTIKDNIISMYNDFKPDIVIHLAAAVGGIGANMKNPGRFFYDNLIMGIQLMEYARLKKIEKFVSIGTTCSYPKYCEVPFKEEDLWQGYPEKTNAPYGLAKKMLIVQSEAYRQQYNFNSISLILANLYGPGDNFDLETSHVIPAIIRKCIEAKKNKCSVIELWGSGSVTREFLYVDDAAEGIILASELYNESSPINIGTGEEISINELAVLIAKLTGYDGIINWNTGKPDGQPRRALDVSKAQKLFGFKAVTGLEEGLIKTINWYKSIDNS